MRHGICIWSVLVCLLLCCGARVRADVERDLDALLDGVSEIGRPGVPGPVLPFGPESFAVVQDRARDGSGRAVVAATRFGKGRVVLFGHGGYTGAKTLRVADTSRLLVNAVRWAGAGGKRVGVCKRYEKGLRPVLEKAGFEVVRIEIASPSDVDAVAARTWEASDAERRALTAFVESGGGLISAGLGWGWKQLNKGKDLATEFPANQLFIPMGLMFADGTTKGMSSRGYDTKRAPSRLLSAPATLEKLKQTGPGKKLSKEDLAQIGATLSLAEQNLPESDTLFRPLLAKAFEGRGTPVPSSKKPVRLADAFGRLAVARETRELSQAAPGDLVAHPAAAAFPGPVPSDAPRVTRTLVIDTSIPRWHSAGLYAAPGEVVRVAVPESATNSKLRVRIGAHKDGIWGRDKWKRHPEITRAYSLKSTRTDTACAFGGLIYIEVPKNAKSGVVSVRIENAVEAPLFVLGETTPEVWCETIREHPAPWGELAAHSIILTIPSELLRDIDDPTPVLEFWDRVMDACADLAARPRERRSPERFVPDVQISAGYMHSGYPLMCHFPQSRDMIDLEKMRKGRWGFFHEIGHNHQNRDWTFSGTTEVTVNLFTLYVYDTVCGIPPHETKHFGKAKRAEKLATFRKNGEKPPFTYLLMYVQMQEAFGWDAFKKVFAEYRDLSQEERPKNDDEKRDQWLVRFSKTVGRNLGPFFETWKVPVSESACRSIADLPEWMPEEMKPLRIGATGATTQ